MIDVLSKYAWAVPIKSKSIKDMIRGLEGIRRQSSPGRPLRVQTNQGKEFYNAAVQAWFKKHGWHHFSTYGDSKASVVERWHRTLKQRTYRYFKAHNTLRYVDVLQPLIHTYNQSYHRSIGMAPHQVTEKKCPRSGTNSAANAWTKRPHPPNVKWAIEYASTRNIVPSEKGWMEEVFVVTHVRRHPVVTYRLSEWDGTPIKGTFYEPDVQKVQVSDDSLFRVEKVLKRKGRNVLVRWKGWPSKYDSWIPAHPKYGAKKTKNARKKRVRWLDQIQAEASRPRASYTPPQLDEADILKFINKEAAIQRRAQVNRMAGVAFGQQALRSYTAAQKKQRPLPRSLVPDVDYRYEASRDVAFQPALTGTRPITFSIPASDDYYHLNELRFQVNVRLTDPAAGYQGLKANLADSDANNTRNTYCVNNFGHTIFRDINMSMNGVLMIEQSNTYHYRTYLETLLNYNREEGATKLGPQGWVNQLNVTEEMGATGANSNTPTNANWKGNAKFRALTSRLLSENWHTFIIRSHLPPLKMGKCLVPGVQLDFELFLNPNSVY